MDRPCVYCEANARGITAGRIGATTEECGYVHRDQQRVYDLAAAMASMFHDSPTDEHIGWFIEDADAVVDDFDTTPEQWQVRQLSDVDEFLLTFSVNDVVYVVEPGGKEPAQPVRLSTLREWEREAEEAS